VLLFGGERARSITALRNQRVARNYLINGKIAVDYKSLPEALFQTLPFPKWFTEGQTGIL
jgi:hypothetical protein